MQAIGRVAWILKYGRMENVRSGGAERTRGRMFDSPTRKATSNTILQDISQGFLAS